MTPVPAGRAGRARLLQRLATARRAVELLQAKLRVLQEEQERYRTEAEQAAAEWAATFAQARTWLVRAALLDGERALAAAVPERPAAVEVTWTVTMGVRHPGSVRVAGGEPEPTAAVPGSSALALAAAAHRTALRACGRHAAAAEAVRRIDAEVAATRRRLRALEERWVPRLVEALRTADLALEELELAEGVRARRALRAL